MLEGGWVQDLETGQNAVEISMLYRSIHGGMKSLILIVFWPKFYLDPSIDACHYSVLDPLISL